MSATNVGIIGLGLMGGSLGRALVRAGGYKVFALDLDEEAMLKGALLEAYDERLSDDNASLLDILVLAVTPSAMKEALDRFLPLLREGALVTDLAGVKRPVVALMEEYRRQFPDISFCGAHPMAGREFSGVAHSAVNLFEGSTVLLVPVDSPLETLAALKNLYTSVGAEGVVITSAEDHDKMISYTSQLAHVVSSAYVQSPSAHRHYGYSAGSFRDMTRVARMNADMWTELMTDNADYLAEEVRDIADRLDAFAACLEKGDAAALHDMLERGNETKLAVEKNRGKKLAEALTETL